MHSILGSHESSARMSQLDLLVQYNNVPHGNHSTWGTSDQLPRTPCFVMLLRVRGNVRRGSQSIRNANIEPVTIALSESFKDTLSITVQGTE